MKISSKGRYALRVMVDLAEQDAGTYIPLKDIAERQGISKKYLENIMGILSKAGLVDAVHGKGGGYRLNRSPAEYPVADILKQTEVSLVPVACLDSNRQNCERSANCRTLPLWVGLDCLIGTYLEGVTLGDLYREPANSP